MASDLLLFQISSVSALIGMTLGWRGVMTRYSGFYDLPTAWSNIFWGILLGGIYGSMIYTEIIIPTIEFEATGGGEIANPINLVLLCLIASIISHFILRRKRVLSGSSQTTSGWALGLAIGGMFGMVVIYAVLRLSEFNLQLVLTVTLLSILAPRCEAIISSYQGQMMLIGRKWGAILRATFWRCLFVVFFTYVLSAPIGWIFILPVMLIANRASEDWIWNSIPKEGKKQLRKIWARQARERKIAKISEQVTSKSVPKESE